MRAGVLFGLGLVILLMWATVTGDRVYAAPLKKCAAVDTQVHGYSAFALKDANGTIVTVGSMKGKVVFLNFWALTCVPCKTEMPTINRLREYFKDDTNLVIMTVDLDNNMTSSTNYMNEKGFGLRVYTIASAIPETLFRGELPTTVVIDKSGRIVLFKEGEGDYGTAEFAGYIDSLVKR